MGLWGAPGGCCLPREFSLPYHTLLSQKGRPRAGGSGGGGCPVLLACWPESCLVLLFSKNKARNIVSLEWETAR